jgi:uncharacterized protein YbjT (DUF2867 family)
MNDISVALAGSTGLIGSLLLEKMVRDRRITKIKALSRRPLSVSSDKVENILLELDRLPHEAQRLRADVFVCCLGTTIKTAGSEEAFRKVDYEYVLEFARAAQACNAKKFLVVSALGANPDSRVFYNRVKGEMEQDLQSLNLFALDIFQPSLLLGARNESRPGEAWAQRLSPLFTKALIGPLKKYRPIQAEDVAQALLHRVHVTSRGLRVFTSEDIQKLAAL